MVSDVNICLGLARLCFPQTQTVYWPEPRVISRGEGDDDIYINLDIIEGSIPTLASILQCPEAVMDLCTDTTTITSLDKYCIGGHKMGQSYP